MAQGWAGRPWRGSRRVDAEEGGKAYVSAHPIVTKQKNGTIVIIRAGSRAGARVKHQPTVGGRGGGAGALRCTNKTTRPWNRSAKQSQKPWDVHLTASLSTSETPKKSTAACAPLPSRLSSRASDCRGLLRLLDKAGGGAPGTAAAFAPGAATAPEGCLTERVQGEGKWLARHRGCRAAFAAPRRCDIDADVRLQVHRANRRRLRRRLEGGEGPRRSAIGLQTMDVHVRT